MKKIISEGTYQSLNLVMNQDRKIRVAVAYGDGIGAEIMSATLRVLDAAGAALDYDVIEIGKKVYEQGLKSGISNEAWDILRKNKLFLKAPITTPQGGGYKSLNVTIRKSLGLYSNVRPCRAFTPYVSSHFPTMDLVVIRENEEDLYAGIEHQQTDEVVQCLKLVTRPGCEKIVRYAFEYARANNRKKVTCMTKDNIMKHADGLFHSVFNEVKQEYPDIESDHFIIDIGSAMLAAQPEQFDVIVTLNLYGDIISDITAQISGSVGLGGSSNIGDDFGMFEAIHGSAPDIAGRDIANPSGLLNGACMMLVHIGQAKIAEKIQNAWLKTLEDGIHTADIYNEAFTAQKVGTTAFADALIERLGQEPTRFKPTRYSEDARAIQITLKPRPKSKKELVGVDIFIDWDENDRNPDVIGNQLQEIAAPNFKLKMITNRGVKVYPNGLPETFKTDHWRCRFVSVETETITDSSNIVKTQTVDFEEIIDLQHRISTSNLDIIKTENLYEFDGKRGYSLGQGE
jgi:isocitrate dehydrogenase